MDPGWIQTGPSSHLQQVATFSICVPAGAIASKAGSTFSTDPAVSNCLPETVRPTTRERDRITEHTMMVFIDWHCTQNRVRSEAPAAARAPLLQNLPPAGSGIVAAPAAYCRSTA